MTDMSTKWRVLAVAALVMLTAGALDAPGQTAASSTEAAQTVRRPSGPAAATGRTGQAGSARAGTTAPRAGAVLPAGFELNRGQTDRRVQFLAHGSGYTLFLTPAEAVLNVTAPPMGRPRASATSARAAGGAVVRLRLRGANAHARVTGLDRLPGATNYLLGHDRRRWRTGVQSYARVAYRGVYRGVDLVYHGARRQLEYDFVLAPGVSPRVIKLDVLGARGLRLDRKGNLILNLPGGSLSTKRPVVYQQVGGRRVAVSGRYALLGRHEVGFVIGRHDTRAPLVIDPVLSYSTYLGGGADSSDSSGAAVAVDSSGDAYVTGSTSSTGFPTTTGAYSSTTAGATDAFVTKLGPTGAISYSTYLGGDDTSAGVGVAVDSGGDAYVTGSTSSTDFPITTGAYSATAAGSADAFVTRLNASGAGLLYSTLLGGGDVDSGAGIALAGPNKVYVTGSTSSADFPATASYRDPRNGGAVFVAALNTAATGRSSLVYSSLLGGNGFDTGGGIAADSAGDAYVTGSTGSTNFPFTAGVYATMTGGGTDAFVTELNPTGVISYSTYLGGGGDDHGQAVAVDSAGDAYITGSTGSTNFPLSNPLSSGGAGSCAGLNRSGGADAFVTKLNATGGALVYSTYLGGSGADAGYGIAVDSSGDAYVTGSTGSTDFPTTTDAYTATNSGGSDAFVSKLDAAGSGLLYSTYLGGGSDDTGYGIAADNAGGLYVTGQTYSTNFPTAGAADIANSGSSSAFVARITGTVAQPSGGAPMATGTPVPACTPVPPAGTATPPPATATPSPASEKGRYTFDDQTANDSSGNGHNGALQGGATITAGGAPLAGGGNDPYALSVNSGGFVDIPGPLVNTAQSFSVAAAVSVTAVGGNYQTFAGIDGQNVSGFFLQLRGANASCPSGAPSNPFSFSQINTDSTGAPTTSACSTLQPSANTWYHLVGVYDAAAHQLRLYVNGQLQAVTPFGGGFTATGDTVIGRGKFGNPGDFVSGKIDEAHFYQGVLTDAQIAALAGVTPANTATATATTMPTSTPTATSTSQPVSTPATPGTTTGALQGSQDMAPISPTSVNLTAEGTADWIEWGDKDKVSSAPDYSGDYNRKAGVSPRISTFNPVGYGTESQFGGGETLLTWSDGTPTQSGANNGQGVYVSGNGNNPPSSGSGFQFTVPADTSTRELRVYVDATKARGQLTASLSDNSAPVYSDSSLSSTSGTAAGVYTLYYRAASAGQTLTVDWQTAVDFGGGVVLEAATLQPVTMIPPTGTPTPVPATATPVPLALNAFYKFDEGTGITATDFSGNNHTGTLQGDAGYTAPGQDNSPYALSLNSSNNSSNNGFVDVPEPVINTAQSYSVAAWVNLNNTSGFHTAVSIDGQHVSAFFLQYCDQCNTFAFAAPGSDADGPSSTRAQATIGLPKVGQWYYLTGVYDAANGVIKLYVDGVLQDTEPYFSAFQVTGHTAIGRGRFNGNPVDFFPGRIDEVCFHQGVLTDAQIAQKTCVSSTTATVTATAMATGTITDTATASATAGTGTPTATGTTGTPTGVTTTGTATTGPAATATATLPAVTTTTTATPSATNTDTSTATATNTSTATSTSTGTATSTATTAPSTGTSTATASPPPVLPRRFCIAGGVETASDHASLALLNPDGAPAHAVVTLYFAGGAPATASVTVPARAQRGYPVASLTTRRGAFGLCVAADRSISGQLTLTRSGRDGDSLLGSPALGQHWFLAEGYTGLTFHETVALLNPGDRAATVALHLLLPGGKGNRTVTETVGARGERVVDINALAPRTSVSIVADADRPVLVERTLTFSSGGYGLTTRDAAPDAATSWLFAEGSTRAPFQTFLTVLNPGGRVAVARVAFFGVNGRRLGGKTLTLAPRSRATLGVNSIVPDTSGVASVVTSDRPIVVERPEYFGSPNGTNVAGSDVFGRAGTARRWVVPGGTVAAGDSEFLLLYNPSARAVPIDITFYNTRNGGTATARVTVAAGARYTFDVNAYQRGTRGHPGPRLAASHGAVLQSRSNGAFVVERSVFGPGHGTLQATQGLAQ